MHLLNIFKISFQLHKHKSNMGSAHEKLPLVKEMDS